jgi:hypothetical protein
VDQPAFAASFKQIQKIVPVVVVGYSHVQVNVTRTTRRIQHGCPSFLDKVLSETT